MKAEIKFPGGYKLPKEERILGGGNDLINPERKAFADNKMKRGKSKKGGKP